MMINYYLLTKPGIILGNLITVAAGVMLASEDAFSYRIFFATLLGLGFVIASACVFNNYIDRNLDQKMKRTQNRPLAKGLVPSRNALLFAVVLGILGNFFLFKFTNLLALCIADFGFLVYVALYSPWKSRTVYGTAIGSIAGAVCPVVGYCAVSQRIDSGAFILFAIMVLWQMPHFFAIALYRLEDYAAASIPVLPLKKGIPRTKIHMLLYIIAFMCAAGLLTIFEYTGYLYLIIAMVLGSTWLYLSIKGFKTGNDQLWARKMFRHSLVVITALFATAAFL
jgi:protoheme IX farnesyltransferase